MRLRADTNGLRCVAALAAIVLLYEAVEHHWSDWRRDFSDADDSRSPSQQSRACRRRRGACGAAATPARHVYFLKTHKCASTTLQRIIVSRGLSRNLSFALPRFGGHYWPRPFSAEASKRTAAYPNFDIMAVHARHSALAKRQMPADAVFVAIVRDPAEQLRSLYEYLQVGSCLGGMAYERFVVELGSGVAPIATKVLRCRSEFRLNMQMYDFGFDIYSRSTADWVRARLGEIDAAFHFVAVAELFDESLVLLSDLLGWDLRDMAYLRNNARVGADRPISDEARRAAYRWNWADKMLYDHFRSKLERAISADEQRVAGALRELAAVQRAWRGYCVNATVSSSSRGGGGGGPATGPDLVEYELTRDGQRNASCQLMAMSELSMLSKVHAAWPEVSSRS